MPAVSDDIDGQPFPRLSDKERAAQNAPTATKGGGGDGDDAEYDGVNPRLAELLKNYAQIGLKEKVLNLETGESFSRSQLEKVFSRPAVLTWFHLHDRNKLSELKAGILIKQKKLEAMADVSPVFKNALARYIYLDGTTDAYDRQLEAIVSLAAVKAAVP